MSYRNVKKILEFINNFRRRKKMVKYILAKDKLRRRIQITLSILLLLIVGFAIWGLVVSIQNLQFYKEFNFIDFTFLFKFFIFPIITSTLIILLGIIMFVFTVTCKSYEFVKVKRSA